MMGTAHHAYNQGVRTVVRRGLGGLFALLLLAPGLGARARAEDLSSMNAPVIAIVLRGGGNVTIRTWEREDVHLDADPTIQINRPRANSQQIAAAFSKFFLHAQSIQAPGGQNYALPPEQFPIPPLAPGDHDALLVRGEGDVTLTVPQDTAVVEAQVSQGSISIEGYHGTILAQMGAGSIHLKNDGGTVAVQLNNGPFIAQHSAFDRVRVRTGRGNMFFSNCRATQIQASSLLGAIVYDNGTFEPGLARFESQHGSVAIGVSNDNAQFLAHSDAGKIYAGNDITLTRSGNDAQASLSRSGPIVSASSNGGSVIFYRGAIARHPELRNLLQLKGPGPNAMPGVERPQP
jgi:hypothetical protein